MDVIAEVTDLTKEYQLGATTVRALRGATFKIQKGLFTALAGASGSGKTTALNLIGAMDRPSSGTIRVDRQNVSSLSEDGRTRFRLEKVGFVFQSFNLIQALTAYQNVELPLLLGSKHTRGEREQMVSRILDEVGLGDKRHHRPAELSGGQQQRVAIARALVKQPLLVLADEPTANLDSATSQVVVELMKQMNKKSNATFVFSTHDEGLMQMADVCIRMKDGKVVDAAH